MVGKEVCKMLIKQSILLTIVNKRRFRTSRNDGAKKENRGQIISANCNGKARWIEHLGEQAK